MTGCQKKDKNIYFIDLPQGGIIYSTGSQETFLQVSVLAAIMCMVKELYF